METMDFLALFGDSDDPSIHKQQIAGLRRAIIGLAQDVDALKRALRERQVLDPLRYRGLRIERMIGDHNGAGAAPWQGYSWFPYLLREEDYLRTHLLATEQEIQDFRREVEFVSQLS